MREFLKFVLSYSTRFGSISVESNKPEDLVEGFARVKQIARELGRSGGRTKPIGRKGRVKEVESTRRGRGETAEILGEVETRLLRSAFFSKPRTTGETRGRLKLVTGRTFTSRKVSQALGILWQAHALKRSGRRNFFRYSA